MDIMSARIKFPSYLYVRVDRSLRAALLIAAEAQGLTVSDLARRELRKALAAPVSQTCGDGQAT